MRALRTSKNATKPREETAGWLTFQNNQPRFQPLEQPKRLGADRRDLLIDRTIEFASGFCARAVRADDFTVDYGINRTFENFDGGVVVRHNTLDRRQPPERRLGLRARINV